MVKFRRRRLILPVLVLIVFLFLVLFWTVRSRLWPVADQLARTQVTNTTSDLINDAIAEQIVSGNIQYDRMIYFEKDLNGRITALKTNMAEVNRLKTDILNLINNEILSQDTSRLGVSLGSLILPEFFAGKGPEIPVKILSIRNSDATFHSYFSEAGINQTFQQLTMDVIVDVTILVLGKTDSFPVSTQVVVAETVIVGDVPDTFLQTGGIHGSERQDQAPD